MRGIVILLIAFVNLPYLFSQSHESKDSELIYVGALETKKSRWPDNTYKPLENTSTKKILRVMFYKEGQKWFSLKDEIADAQKYPSGREWYIAFDGKGLGTFHSKKEKVQFIDAPWTYPRDAYHSILEKELPTIGTCSEEFSSWANEKEIRPLIVVSSPNFCDPEKWKPFLPDYSDLDKLYPIYKSFIIGMFPSLTDISKTQLRYSKSYQSFSLDQLIQIGMIMSDDPEKISYPIWIFKSASGEIKNISKMIDYDFCQDDFTDDDYSKVTLIDAGDYDSNGKSEIIFWTSRYDGDGYVMFYNDFTSMIDFTWRYH